MKKKICVDLDGTLLKYTKWEGEDHFGEPLSGAKEFLQELAKKFYVIIYTTRTKLDIPDRPEGISVRELRDKVAFILDHYKLYYDEIYCDQGKPLCEYFIDDRAINIPFNPSQNDYKNVLKKVL